MSRCEICWKFELFEILSKACNYSYTPRFRLRFSGFSHTSAVDVHVQVVVVAVHVHTCTTINDQVKLLLIEVVNSGSSPASVINVIRGDGKL